MAFPEDITPAWATVEGRFVSIAWDGVDADLAPDVQPLNGTVTLTPTVTAGRIDSVLAQILTVTARIFAGQIVDATDQPGIRILATDADIGIEDWAWTARFAFDSGLQVKPLTFLAPTGATVNLTSGIVPVDSAPYQLVQGEPGESAYQVAVRNGYAGTEAAWLASLKGEKGDTPTWDDLTGKPDIDGLADRLAVLEYDTGWRSFTPVGPHLTGEGKILFRRVGPAVYCRFDAVGVASTIVKYSYITDAGFIPSGFRPEYYGRPLGLMSNSNANPNYIIGIAQGSRFRYQETIGATTLPGTGSQAITGQMQWSTLEDRPSLAALPGDPT